MSTENFFWALIGGGILNVIWNLIAHYLTPYTDQILGIFSERRRRAKKEKQERIEHHVERMLADPHEVTHAEIYCLNHHQSTLLWIQTWLLFGVGAFLYVNLSPALDWSRPETTIGVYFAAALTTILGVAGTRKSASKEDEVREALSEYRKSREQEENGET